MHLYICVIVCELLIVEDEGGISDSSRMKKGMTVCLFLNYVETFYSKDPLGDNITFRELLSRYRIYVSFRTQLHLVR